MTLGLQQTKWELGGQGDLRNVYCRGSKKRLRVLILNSKCFDFKFPFSIHTVMLCLAKCAVVWHDQSADVNLEMPLSAQRAGGVLATAWPALFCTEGCGGARAERCDAAAACHAPAAGRAMLTARGSLLLKEKLPHLVQLAS